MNFDDKFPEDFLSQSVNQRITYFQNKTVHHPKLLQAYERLETCLIQPAGVAIILLLGPTGVGKTTLL